MISFSIAFSSSIRFVYDEAPAFSTPLVKESVTFLMSSFCFVFRLLPSWCASFLSSTVNTSIHTSWAHLLSSCAIYVSLACSIFSLFFHVSGVLPFCETTEVKSQPVVYAARGLLACPYRVLGEAWRGCDFIILMTFVERNMTRISLSSIRAELQRYLWM